MMKSRITAILDKWELFIAQYVTVMAAGGVLITRGARNLMPNFQIGTGAVMHGVAPVNSRGISRNLAKKTV